MNNDTTPHDTANDPDRIWRDLNFDVAWESTESGVIRCRGVFNRRKDIFKAIEGVNLRAIHCESFGKSAHELLGEGRVVRHVEVRLPDRFGPERLYLTAGPARENGFAGTFCAVDQQSDEAFKGRLTLLGHVAESRAREEEQRREAEIMLRGLRALLSSSTASQRLEILTSLAVEAIKGASHLLLEILRDGRVRLMTAEASIVPNSEALSELCRAEQSQVTVHKEGGEHTAELRKLLGVNRGEIALMLLPIASESIALICAAQRSEGFRSEDVGFASRFALILRQALVLKDEQDKLVQAARLSALGQMSASLAHELRQPLNTISVAAENLELMAENGPVPVETLNAKVQRIQQQVERASQIMDRIRRFSRKNGGALAKVDVGQLVEGIRLLMEHDVLAAGLRLETDVPQGLSVCCDAIQIEQVLTNLVRNAMDALMGIGTAERTSGGVITIRAQRAEKNVALRVEDNGPGFPPDVASRPLETFYTSKGADVGTGLGLSICHMIAREHAGNLAIGNNDGKGAYVEIRLPDRQSAEAA